jgi:hypothetical protein
MIVLASIACWGVTALGLAEFVRGFFLLRAWLVRCPILST